MLTHLSDRCPFIDGIPCVDANGQDSCHLRQRLEVMLFLRYMLEGQRDSAWNQPQVSLESRGSPHLDYVAPYQRDQVCQVQADSDMQSGMLYLFPDSVQYLVEMSLGGRLETKRREPWPIPAMFVGTYQELEHQNSEIYPKNM